MDAFKFEDLKDGVYHGYYKDGIYGWRANECDAPVSEVRVVAVRLICSRDAGAGNTDHDMFFERVIKTQSLQLNSIRGTMLTLKAYLQCVKNALVKVHSEE